MYINKRSVAYKEPRGCMELDWTVQSEMVPVSIKKNPEHCNYFWGVIVYEKNQPSNR